ncbi:uncharacterized protein LOC122265333 [Penaeus japonicus]|uniref:uncharacterized protein LOC122265333 n=1 Tax=Penaeus japonicus TaxID=27405 RepID=UPI001C71138E|nr:uncharacterized protein LOC122265333 [Penaeus japonicus]
MTDKGLLANPLDPKVILREIFSRPSEGYKESILPSFSGARAAKCMNKTELDTCLEKVAGYMPKSGLPADRQQLINMCRAFKGGMKCVDNYTAKCMTANQRTALEEHLKGARATLAFLCDDPVFQKDYLSHGQCIIDVRDDWDKCHNHFKYLVNRAHVRSNITQAKRDHNICCIRAGFLSCVYGISYFKCGKNEAMFLKKVTETLSYSDVHQERCRNVSLRTCSSGRSSSALGRLVALALSVTMALARY